MPNKMIYVSDADLPLLTRAQELGGGNLSATVVRALRRYVADEEGKAAGFQEITVKVGPGKGRKLRFVGVKLGEWGHSTSTRVEVFRVYKTRTGKFAVHLERSPDVKQSALSWRSYLGLDEQSWGVGEHEARLDVYDTLETLREHIPPELFDLIAVNATHPEVEDLDI